VATSASDLPFSAASGGLYQTGPGPTRGAHTDQERISKRELMEGVGLYTRLARDLLAGTA
jgi:acetylornithine deacetylase/succinyl-diaminopimelate desuccinylase-like protein